MRLWFIKLLGQYLEIIGDSVVGMIDLHRKDIAEKDIRAFLCYGQILYPEEMKLKAREILESSIQKYNMK